MLKFDANKKNSIDLRVAHMFDEDEDQRLSKPVLVDLSSFRELMKHYTTYFRATDVLLKFLQAARVRSA